MDGDVDMDIPQIQTLKEEVTPPPQRRPRAAIRSKVVNKVISPARLRDREYRTDEEFAEAEDEEDQLVDECEITSHLGRSTALPSKCKAPTKRKRNKGDGKSAEIKNVPNDKRGSHQTPSDLAPTVSWFKAVCSQTHIDKLGKQGTHAVDSVEDLAAPMQKLRVSASHKRATLGSKKFIQQKALVPTFTDEMGMASEGESTSNLSKERGEEFRLSYDGTTASTPTAAQYEPNSPEPEPVSFFESAPAAEESSLEDVPLPVYPLPSKPFPVQPPPKIPTGFAPAASLDKNHNRVRRWRVAQREVRGIAGGRWFVRTWVGGKDSEYSAIAMTIDDKPSVPRLVGLAIPGPPGKVSGKSKKVTTSCLATSVPQSRSGSTIPEMASTTFRAPTTPLSVLPLRTASPTS